MSSKWWLGGGFLFLHFLIAWISRDGGPNSSIWFIPLVVSIEIAAALLYLIFVRKDLQRYSLLFIVFVGLAVRIVLLFSIPILEDDYHRYFWDGAVTAKGLNPYKWSPAEIINSADNLPDPIAQLAAESKTNLELINYPAVRTVYPPVSQLIFLLSHWLGPWSLLVWRIVLLVFDLLTVYLIFLLLKTLGLPLSWIAIYWWNPLLVRETFNAAHMDVLTLPFVLLAFLMAIRKKRMGAICFLSLATATKLWPLLLFPLLVRSIADTPKKLVAYTLLFSALSLLLFSPVFLAGLDRTSGFVLFGAVWEMNDSIFLLLQSILQRVLALHSAYAVSRILTAAIVIIFAFYVARNRIEEPDKMFRSALSIIALAFLLSPAQFPWYYVWMLPFLALQPRRSLLLLTALLPLYYLRFFFGPRGNVELFDYGIVWIEYIPVWWLLISEYVSKRELPRPITI